MRPAIPRRSPGCAVLARIHDKNRHFDHLRFHDRARRREPPRAECPLPAGPVTVRAGNLIRGSEQHSCGVGGPAGSRRLRQVRWKEWKSTAARRHNLRVRGISESDARKWADSGKGYWRVAGSGGPSGVPARCLQEPPRPAAPHPDPAASQSDGLTNRRMRARMSGGVAGGRATPPPPRSCISVVMSCPELGTQH